MNILYWNSDWLVQNKDILASVASIATIISLFFLLLASLASRKQNILKTAPLFALSYINREIVLINLNKTFAYKFTSEPFIHVVNKATLLLEPGKYIYKLRFSGPNYISPNEDRRSLTLLVNNKPTNEGIMHYMFSRLIDESSGGIYLFFRDAQNYRFIMKVKTIHDDTTINNGVIFEVVKSLTYLPWYRIDIWLKYLIRTVLKRIIPAT